MNQIHIEIRNIQFPTGLLKRLLRCVISRSVVHTLEVMNNSSRGRPLFAILVPTLLHCRIFSLYQNDDIPIELPRDGFQRPLPSRFYIRQNQAEEFEHRFASTVRYICDRSFCSYDLFTLQQRSFDYMN